LGKMLVANILSLSKRNHRNNDNDRNKKFHNDGKQYNAGLQLRRAICIQAEGTRLLEKHAIAPSAARLCSAAPLGSPLNLPKLCKF
jgi:hypothetical protein